VEKVSFESDWKSEVVMDDDISVMVIKKFTMPGVSRRRHLYVQQRSNTYWPAIGF